MRSPSDYIVTKDEVHGYASDWLASTLKLNYQGTECTASTLIQILLIAATLPEIGELERRLNLALSTNLPRALHRKPRIIAINLTLIPYHGEPLWDAKEIYRSNPKSGTTHFHAYATAVVLHKGHRYTLALTHVEHGEAMKEVVQRLLKVVRQRDVRIKLVLLDKGFYSVEVISYLKRAKYGFILPTVPRGRKPKRGKAASGLRGLLRKKHGYYAHTMHSNKNKMKRSADVTICVASKSYTHRKSGTRRRKKLLYAIWKVRLSPRQIREMYRQRFGIETSYRQMNEARIRTCTRNPALRLLFVGIALVLRNVWVWLHFKLAKGKHLAEPQLFLELLRFNEMLLWITQVVQRVLHADQKQGIDLETYQRVTAKC